jgi:hypothetical protein
VQSLLSAHSSPFALLLQYPTSKIIAYEKHLDRLRTNTRQSNSLDLYKHKSEVQVPL